jgi:hypothetical protein
LTVDVDSVGNTESVRVLAVDQMAVSSADRTLFPSFASVKDPSSFRQNAETSTLEARAPQMKTLRRRRRT